jgi:DnaJ-class molecular chaperone
MRVMSDTAQHQPTEPLTIHNTESCLDCGGMGARFRGRRGGRRPLALHCPTCNGLGYLHRDNAWWLRPT